MPAELSSFKCLTNISDFMIKMNPEGSTTKTSVLDGVFSKLLRPPKVYPQRFFIFLAIILSVTLLCPAIAPETQADSGIFQYAVWRAHDKIVKAPYVDGVVVYLHWNVLEREPGNVNLEPLSRIRSRAEQGGKRFILRIVTAEHTPSWLYRMGVPKVYEKIDNRLQPVPLYWHPVYLERLNSLVEKIAQNLDGKSSLASVQIGIATYGEMLLGGREWLLNGFTPQIWTQTCANVIDIYRSHFKKTPLVVMIMSQEFPGGRQTESMLPVAEYAATNGIGLQFNGLSPDNSYLWGLMDKPDPISAISILRKFRKLVPLYFEMTSKEVDVRLSCLNALSEQASFLFVYASQLEDQEMAPVFEFTRRFLGKTPSSSNAVWTLLRQTFPEESVRTGKKNYDFGIEQIDVDGLKAPPAEGGPLTISSKTTAMENLNGLPCRRTLGSEQFHHMVFKIADEFDAGPNPTLTVIYADIGHDLWFPIYTSQGKFISCRPVQKNNSGRWLRADFRLENFSKNSAADLLIYSNNDGDEFIHFVELTRGGIEVVIPFSDSDVSH